VIIIFLNGYHTNRVSI